MSNFAGTVDEMSLTAGVRDATTGDRVTMVDWLAAGSSDTGDAEEAVVVVGWFGNPVLFHKDGSALGEEPEASADLSELVDCDVGVDRAFAPTSSRRGGLMLGPGASAGSGACSRLVDDDVGTADLVGPTPSELDRSVLGSPAFAGVVTGAVGAMFLSDGFWGPLAGG